MTAGHRLHSIPRDGTESLKVSQNSENTQIVVNTIIICKAFSSQKNLHQYFFSGGESHHTSYIIIVLHFYMWYFTTSPAAE